MSSKYLVILLIVTSGAIFRGQTTDQFQFEHERGGDGTTKDGNRFSFQVYTSQDGVALLTYIEEYPTRELANRAMDEKAREASSIIARGPRLDRNGEYLGERVVLTVEKKTQGEVESESFICWTTGSRLHWIQSKSLKHALAYENMLYPRSNLFRGKSFRVNSALCVEL
jgi:hypothetical protein